MLKILLLIAAVIMAYGLIFFVVYCLVKVGKDADEAKEKILRGENR